MACQQLFIDLRQQMVHYWPTLSHNENQEGALLLSGGVRKELMKGGRRKGHHAAWGPVDGALLPLGSTPSLDSPSDFKETESVWGEESPASSYCPWCVSALQEVLMFVWDMIPKIHDHEQMWPNSSVPHPADKNLQGFTPGCRSPGF